MMNTNATDNLVYFSQVCETDLRHTKTSAAAADFAAPRSVSRGS